MRTRTRTLIAVALAAAAAITVAAYHQTGPAPGAQHHQAADPQAHLDAVINQLSLTSEQRQALAGPLAELAAAMREVHRLHDVITAELSDEQKAALAEAMKKHHGGAHPPGHRPSHGGAHR